MSSDRHGEPQKEATEGNSACKGEGTLSPLASSIQSFAVVYQANQAQQREHDRRVLFWTIFDAIAIFAYTAFTLAFYINTVIHNGISNKISRQANEINRQSFVAVQRAFVNVVDLKMDRGRPGAAQAAGLGDRKEAGGGRRPADHIL